jgi:hypothetical protein
MQIAHLSNTKFYQFSVPVVLFLGLTNLIAIVQYGYG